MTHIPENSAEESPDDLQQTTYQCQCMQEFDTAQELAEHTVQCDEAAFDQEEG